MQTEYLIKDLRYVRNNERRKIMTITYPIDNNLYVNITNKCSNRCEFCIRNFGDSMGTSNTLWLEKEPTSEEILADILKNDLYRYKELVFCGYGEPLQRLETVVEVLKELKKHSQISVRINTNGQADLIYDRPTAQELKGLVDIISISLNAPDAQSYDKMCHSNFGEAAFDAILKYASDCKNYIPEVIMTVVDVIDTHQIELCRELTEKLGVTFRVRHMTD